MGIDIAVAMQLVAARDYVLGTAAKPDAAAEKPAGRGLMLGRQRLRLPGKGRRRLRQALRHAGLSADIPDYLQDDGYAETFLQKIGYPAFQSMDISGYEGCDVTHDLNQPVPKALHGAFDVIIDGGTLEHVYNVPAALDNVYAMLAPGGVFISVNGLTGWAGHGFYQFGPELAWRYWQDMRQCAVNHCAAVPLDPEEAPVAIRDTGARGARFRGAGLNGRWYLAYVVSKPAGAVAAPKGGVLQGDYQVRWGSAGPADQDQTAPALPDGIAHDLTSLADHFGSDKGSKKHRYTELYHMLFQPFINRPITFMEMGLLIGGPEHGKSADRRTKDLPSIRMWLAYFRQAQIIGLDVSDFSWFTDDRFRFVRCDMDCRKNIAAAARDLPALDIILDDASHASHHQQSGFLELFPKLKSGGMYIIEDLIWQPPPYEKKGITKTAALFQSYLTDRSFAHSDKQTAAAFNALAPDISGCFVFQKHFQKHRRDQVLVVHKR